MRKGQDKKTREPQTQDEWKQVTTGLINDAIARGESFLPGSPNFEAVQDMWRRGIITGEVLTKVNNIAGIDTSQRNNLTGEIRPLKEFSIPEPRNIRNELRDAGAVATFPIVQSLSGRDRRAEGLANIRRIGGSPELSSQLSGRPGGPATAFVANLIRGIPDAGAAGIGTGIGTAIAGLPGGIVGGLISGFAAPYIRNKIEGATMPVDEKTALDSSMAGLEERFPLDSIGGQAMSSLAFGGATSSLGRTANIGRLLGGVAGAGIETGQQVYDIESGNRPKIDWQRIAGQFVANALVSGGRNTQLGDALEGGGFAVGRRLRPRDRSGNPLPGYEQSAPQSTYQRGEADFPFLSGTPEPGTYHVTQPSRYSEFPFERRNRQRLTDQYNLGRLQLPEGRQPYIRPRGAPATDPDTGDPIGYDYTGIHGDNFSGIDVPLQAPIHRADPRYTRDSWFIQPGTSQPGPRTGYTMPLQDPTMPLQGLQGRGADVDPSALPEPQVEAHSASSIIEDLPEPEIVADLPEPSLTGVRRKATRRVATKKAVAARRSPAKVAADDTTVESNQQDYNAPGGVLQSGDDRLDFEYQVVPVSQVHGSHDIEGRKNPEYKGVQTRLERDSPAAIAALRENLAVGKFNPTYLLADDPSGVSGAPFVGENMSSISGSGRIAMLKSIMSGNDKASVELRRAYNEALNNRAKELGITVPGGRIPDDSILVRVNKTKLDESGLARVADEMNAPVNLGKTAAEEANSLARRAKEKGVFDNLDTDDESMAMIEVVRRLAKAGVIPAKEQTKYVTTGGGGKAQTITRDGSQRLNNMLIAAAYRDHDFLTKAADSPSTSKIVDAATRTALDIAVARSVGDPDMDITDKIAENSMRGTNLDADYNEYMRASKSGTPGLLDITPGQAAISAVMSDKDMAGSVHKFASFLKEYSKIWKSSKTGENDGLSLDLDESVSESKQLDAIRRAADAAGASKALVGRLDDIKTKAPEPEAPEPKTEKSNDDSKPSTSKKGARSSKNKAPARTIHENGLSISPKDMLGINNLLMRHEDVKSTEVSGEYRYHVEEYRKSLEKIRDFLKEKSEILNGGNSDDLLILKNFNSIIDDIDSLIKDLSSTRDKYVPEALEEKWGEILEAIDSDLIPDIESGIKTKEYKSPSKKFEESIEGKGEPYEGGRIFRKESERPLHDNGLHVYFTDKHGGIHHDKSEALAKLSRMQEVINSNLEALGDNKYRILTVAKEISDEMMTEAVWQRVHGANDAVPEVTMTGHIKNYDLVIADISRLKANKDAELSTPGALPPRGTDEAKPKSRKEKLKQEIMNLEVCE